MAHYLVTGAAGFIGSSIARKLVAMGHKVRGIDDFSTGKVENLAGLENSLDFREASVLDSAALAAACEGVDCVFHEAALPSVPKSIADPELTNAVNVGGTLSLLIAARDAGVRRVVYAASSSAYGDSETLPKREDMTPHPISPYAIQKLAGEYYMQVFSSVYGLETVCLRYFNVFGPRQDANSEYSAVLAKFITQMLRGDTPTIFGDGQQSRDFAYIDNAVAANLRACSAPAAEVTGRVFNIATGKRFSLNQIYQMLQGLTGFAAAPKYVSARTGDIKHSLADISLAQKHLGYCPEVSFEEGLKRTVEWYQQRATPVEASRAGRQLKSAIRASSMVLIRP